MSGIFLSHSVYVMYMCGCRVTGGFIAVGCLLYPLGWNNAEVVEACGALAHRYSWGQHGA